MRPDFQPDPRRFGGPVGVRGDAGLALVALDSTRGGVHASMVTTTL